MISLQILNKVLQTKDFSIIENNALTADEFIGYENEFNFIVEHYKKYGNVPDTESVLNRFDNFEVLNVSEPDNYLLDTLFEEVLYYKSVDVVQNVAELLKTDATEAVNYLHSRLTDLQIQQSNKGVDIIKTANERLDLYNDKMVKSWYIQTGFEELDNIINGWSRGEELAVIFARTGQGKSWFLMKALQHAWKQEERVGYISPEMTPVKLGYRFDTLFKNFSNRNLFRGENEPDYAKYISDLTKHETPFVVAQPKDFDKRITVSKLKSFVIQNKLTILGIDGITYLSDERHKKGDTKTISLTNISEDLMQLSNDLGIPILVVVQSNRSGVRDNENQDTPDIENIRDSDGIAQNATKVISLKQSAAGLQMGIKKHRDGATGGKLLYYWDIDKGIFNYIPVLDDSNQPERRNEVIKTVKKQYRDKADVF